MLPGGALRAGVSASNFFIGSRNFETSESVQGGSHCRCTEFVQVTVPVVAVISTGKGLALWSHATALVSETLASIS